MRFTVRCEGAVTLLEARDRADTSTRLALAQAAVRVRRSGLHVKVLWRVSFFNDRDLGTVAITHGDTAIGSTGLALGDTILTERKRVALAGASSAAVRVTTTPVSSDQHMNGGRKAILEPSKDWGRHTIAA